MPARFDVYGGARRALTARRAVRAKCGGEAAAQRIRRSRMRAPRVCGKAFSSDGGVLQDMGGNKDTKSRGAMNLCRDFLQDV